MMPEISALPDDTEMLPMLNSLQLAHLPQAEIQSDRLKWLSRLKVIPLLAKLLDNIDESGESLVTLEKHVLHAHQAAKALDGASRGFHYFGFALSVVDFFRIPVVLIAARLLGEPVPFTVNKGAKWLYSGILLGLGIAALAVPAAAPFIAIAAASLVLTASVATIGKNIIMRFKIRRELKNINKQIDTFEQRLISMRHESEKLNAQWALADAKNKDELKKRAAELYADYEQIKNNETLQKLVNQRQQLQDERGQLGIKSALISAATAAIAATALVGLVLTLYFPVAGLSLLLVAAIAGIGLLIGVPLVTTVIPWLFKKIKNKLAPSAQTPEDLSPKISDELSYQDDHSPTASPSQLHASDAEIVHALEGHHDVTAQKATPIEAQKKSIPSPQPKGQPQHAPENESEGEGEKEVDEPHLKR